ncbi:MAG TPA: hypothetical protein VMA31_10590 [Bryobacteraceae bacterium]|nr:hypothetical protein [Bryobacteraceae bacterium]
MKLRSFCCAAVLIGLGVAAAAQAPEKITLRTVQGDNAINSIRMHRGHDPEVQVLTESGEPLSRAIVSFLLPASGASGRFANGELSVTVPTDEHGIAIGRGLVPNQIEGQFRIRVTASWQGLHAIAAIAQTNAEPPLKTSHSKWILVVLLAGGAAGGAVAALHGGKSSNNSSSATITSGVSIVAGTPTLGPPH